jgi:hypothetical protein
MAEGDDQKVTKSRLLTSTKELAQVFEEWCGNAADIGSSKNG